MPLGTLPKVPDGLHAVAWSAFTSLLKNDATLVSYGVTWKTWDGSDPALETQTPAPGDPPLVQLTPWPEPSSWEAVGLQNVGFLAKVDISVGGSNVFDVLNVFDALVAACYPGNMSFWNALTAACPQFISLDILQPACMPGPGPVMRAEGAFRIKLMQTTM